MKKILSVLLSVLLLFAAVLPAFAEGDASPVVYVPDGAVMRTEAGEPVLPDASAFADAVYGETEAVFKTALYLGRWDVYFAQLLSVTETAFAAYRPDETGAFAGTPAAAQEEGFPNTFVYDARLDPCALAEELKAYIENILADTGAETVRLVSRGFGCCVAAAYVTVYGWEALSSFVTVGSAAKGSAFVGEAFSGYFNVDDAAVTAYARQEYRWEEPLSALLAASVKNVHKIGIRDAGERLTTGLLRADAVPAILRASYALCPGAWALVDEENYENAKTYLLGEADAGLIRTIDAYHYNVQQKLEETLLSMREDGVYVYLVSSCGAALPPVTESFAAPSDGLVPYYQQSCAAEAVLSDENVSLAEFLLPETTWCVKGLARGALPAAVADFVKTLAESETEITVHTDGAYTQFLTYDPDAGTLSVPVAEPPAEPAGFIARLFAEFRRAVKVFFIYVRSFLVSNLGKLTA